MSKTYDWCATEPDPSLPVVPDPSDDGPPPIEPDDLGPQHKAAPDFAATQAAKEPKKPFDWAGIETAANVWTDDPAAIASLSDPAIVEGLIREREVVQIVGASKTAKTWFAQNLVLSVTSGADFIGRRTYPRRVLYLDYELKRGTFAKRVSMLADACPNGLDFMCLRGVWPLPEVSDIAALVQRNGYGLVVIDSLYRTGWITDENNNNTTSRELAKLQEFTRATNCSLVVIDHTAKGAAAERSAVDSSRGASAKGGFFDAVLLLRPSEDGTDTEALYSTLDPVLRDWPAFKELPLLAFRWTPTTCEIEVEGSVAKGSTDSASGKILEVLTAAETVMRQSAIQKATGLSESTVRRSLNTLWTKKKVEQMRDPTSAQAFVYSLAKPRQTPPNPGT